MNWDPSAAWSVASQPCLMMRYLDWIEDYVSHDNPIAAPGVRERIEGQVTLLKHKPGMGRQGRVRGTREVVLTTVPYMRAHRSRGKAVQSVRALHGPRHGRRRRG